MFVESLNYQSGVRLGFYASLSGNACGAGSSGVLPRHPDTEPNIY